MTVISAKEKGEADFLQSEECQSVRRCYEAHDAPFGGLGGGVPVEPRLPLTFGTGEGIGLIDLSDEVGPALF